MGNWDAGKFAADTTQLPMGCQPESLAKPARPARLSLLPRRAAPGPPPFRFLTPVVGARADIPSPEQLVAVHIPLTPFQDADHCETMPCVVTPGGDYETPGVHHAGCRPGGVAGRAPPTGFAGHAGATANLKLTFHLGHSAEADQLEGESPPST